MERTESTGDADSSDFGVSDIRTLFAISGEVGADLAVVDWESTPLGPPGAWPQSLKTVVGVLLTSRFSMWMAWGPELTFFCNEAYRRQTLGSKYPWALGRPAPQVWAEIWSDIGPLVEEVMTAGVATWDESLLLFLERSGYREETYHTFSYSPLADDHGWIAGMLCVVSEETDRVIGDQRLTALRRLGTELAAVRTEDDVLAIAERCLGADTRILPFSLVYRFDRSDGASPVARLVATAGSAPGDPFAPEVVDPADPEPRWPAGQMLGGQPEVVDLVGDGIPTGAWDEPPTQALAVPLAQVGETPYGFLVVGLDRYRPLDAGYRGFVSLVASQLAASIANARAYDQQRQRAEALVELDQAKTTFFTNVSHEFRTPLTLLLGPAEDALADMRPEVALAPEQRTRIELVLRNGQRLARLVNSLLDFSQLESNRMTPQFEPVDLPAFTTQLASMFASAADRAGLDFEVVCPRDPDPDLGNDPRFGRQREPVFVDREMWAKIVSNLLSNALKFTFDGRISLRLTSDDDPEPSVELEVSDTGTGIEPADQAHLFERFHRVAGVRSRTHEGSGIGLALVAELAAIHGGQVGVESQPGVGSTFTVRLPRGSAHLPPDQVVPPREGTSAVAERYTAGMADEPMAWIGIHDAELDIPSQPGASPGDRPRVLVADDNADMRHYIASLLVGSYTVELAPDGAVALELAIASPPDLVLTDVMMPNLDGFGLLAALRSDPRTRQVPVVMLSARAGEAASIEGLEAGADDYLVKPFSALELTARVRSVLKLERIRREAGRDRALLAEVEVSKERLDQAQRLAKVGSWEIDLSTGAIRGSDQFLRMIHVDADRLAELGLDALIAELVHPDDREAVIAALAAGAEGSDISYQGRVVEPDGTETVIEVRGEVVRDETGVPIGLRGSAQDVTEQRAAEAALAEAALFAEAARQEHRIADDLQKSLVPAPRVQTDHLRVAMSYRPGEQGTQVGGDWYDVIELPAGRTALVIGDVMGHGVRAAATMGQLRAALRAYSRLDLAPAEVLESLDATVRDFEGGQIVTCIYAVYDPVDRSFVYSNAGHPSPLMVEPGQPVRRLTGALAPPLGVDPVRFPEDRLSLAAGATVLFYTDGLVERRDQPLDAGIDILSLYLGSDTGTFDDLPDRLVNTFCPDGADDDVAILAARVPDEAALHASANYEVSPEEGAISATRRLATETLRQWEVPDATLEDVVLMASELVTNAIVHGLPPIELRLSRMSGDVLLEVNDGGTLAPRRMRPGPDEEHGRGLQIVAMLADRWGTRTTDTGKSIWCITSMAS